MEEFIAFLPYTEGALRCWRGLTTPSAASCARPWPGLKERAKTLVELKTGAAFLFAVRPLALDEKAKQIIADGGMAALQDLKPVLEACSEWTAAALEAAVKAHAEKNGIKLGKLAQPLRAALTGTSTSPPIFDVLDVLGREEAMGRINDLLN